MLAFWSSRFQYFLDDSLNFGAEYAWIAVWILEAFMGLFLHIPTLETLAAVTLLHSYVPDIRIRVVNVLDLMVLQPESQLSHGVTKPEFDDLFTSDKPVIFAFHGYPAIIYKLTYPGAITTTFMCAATRKRAPPQLRSIGSC